VLVENKPGAAGAIGLKQVAQSKADGYTLALASDSATLLDVLNPNPQWKFKGSLVGVAMVGDQPISLAVPAASPFKQLSDVVAAARKKPGELGFGSSGVGSGQHVVGSWWAKLAGINITHVPYKGGGQAAVDLVGNQVPMAVLGLAPMLALALMRWDWCWRPLDGSACPLVFRNPQQICFRQPTACQRTAHAV
jgi:tripartite-type tricarboxylate transporter receptor subunit TctC